MDKKITIPLLQQMKRDGQKIVGAVVWDYQMACIADKAGIEVMSVGDSVGVNLWGYANPLEVTMDEMVTVAKAVRRGTSRALLSCDFPFGPLQMGTDAALAAAIRLVKECGVDMIKLDGAANYPDVVSALTCAGIPVWAQFGVTPQTALQYGIEYAAMSRADAQIGADMLEKLVSEAKMLEKAGAVLLDFTNSGPIVGPAVTSSVEIPVIGGFGGGPWLDGRVRMAHAAIGYSARFLEGEIESYANVARIAYDALQAFSKDVRAGRQIKGAPAGKK